MAEALHRAWRKSSYSDVNGNCVELAPTGGGVAVRDSKDPGPVLVLDAGAFAGLLAAVKGGGASRSR